MAKVYVVKHYRYEHKMKGHWLTELTGLNDFQCDETIVRIFDTEDKAKDFIRNAIRMDHELNGIRRERGLDAFDYKLDERNLRDGGLVRSYKYSEKGVRTSVWYEYHGYDVM